MPYITTVPPAEATGELADTYGRIQAVFGSVPDALQLSSLSPPLMRNLWESITYYLNHPTLGGPLLTFLRLSVSSEVRCEYCIGFNGAMLVNLFGWTTEQLAAAKRDIDAAPLSDNEKALIRYCVDAVRSGGRVDRVRLNALRQLGWGDRDILDAVAHATRNVASDIMINAFGLDSEPAMA